MIRQQGALSARKNLADLFRIVRQNDHRKRNLFGLCSVSKVRCHAMRIMERIEAAAAVLHHSKRTVDVYQAWVRRFLEFHRDAAGRWRHPRELRGGEVSAFLTYLAHERRLSASSQNQAMNAIVFLYGQVLAQELEPDHLGPIVAQRASRPSKVPTVLSAAEVRRLIDAMRPGAMHRLMTELLYGCGLRLMECCTLRVRDLDFDRAQIIVRQAKGDKDRVVMLPHALNDALHRGVADAAQRYAGDIQRGGGFVPVCDAVAHKLPNAQHELAWQFVFASRVLRFDEQQRGYRWYTDKAALDRAIRSAARRAGLVKRVSAHTLRHSFATHLLEAGYDIRQAQQLLGHASVTTTMIYTHVMNKPSVSVTSPLDRLGTGPLDRLAS